MYGPVEMTTSSRATRSGEGWLSLVVEDAGEGGLHSPRRLSRDSTAADVRTSSLVSCGRQMQYNFHNRQLLPKLTPMTSISPYTYTRDTQV